MNDIWKMLKWARKTTKKIMKETGEWNYIAQINHTFTEIGELNNALRHGKSIENVAMEIWDIVFSAITIAHCLEIPDEQLFLALHQTIAKLEKRIRNGYYGGFKIQ